MIIQDYAAAYAEIAATRRELGKPISQFDAMISAVARYGAPRSRPEMTGILPTVGSLSSIHGADLTHPCQ